MDDARSVDVRRFHGVLLDMQRYVQEALSKLDAAIKSNPHITLVEAKELIGYELTSLGLEDYKPWGLA